MRGLLLVLGLLLAGCVDEGALPTPTPEPTNSPTPAAPTIPRTAPSPSPPSTPSPPMSAECGSLTLTANPMEASPGEEIRFVARFENCGARTISRTTPCLSRGWQPVTILDGTRYHVVNGSAHSSTVCLTAIGNWSVPPGQAMTDEWTWNLTFVDSNRSGALPEDAAPGAYTFVSTLSGRDAASGGRIATPDWIANVTVRVRG